MRFIEPYEMHKHSGTTHNTHNKEIHSDISAIYKLTLTLAQHIKYTLYSATTHSKHNNNSAADQLKLNSLIGIISIIQ